MEKRIFLPELKLGFLATLACFVAALGQGADSTRNLLQTENIFYTELKLVKKYYGFNEVINTTTPADNGFIKKYRRLEWSGSVKESGTQSYKGTQRTDFTGSATFNGAVLSNGLLRREFRNLNDPANEGDGSGGPYIVQGDAGGGCHPLNTANLLTEFTGTPGSNVAASTQITIVGPTRRETLGHMNLLWSRILFPCNLFTFQTPSDTYQSMGPIVEQLSEPADAVIVTDTRTTGYRVTPTATLVYRMEANSPWTPLSPTPGLLEDTAYECVLQFRPPSGETCVGKTYTVVLSIEKWEGTAPHTFETRRYSVTPDPSRSALGEIETTVTLRAEKIGQSMKLASAALEMDGPSCSTGCSTEPGGTAARLDSVNWSMDLGLLPGGKSAGQLAVKRDVWSAALYSPVALAYAPPGLGNAAGATVLRADNTLRQIRTGTYLVDIITPAEDPGLAANSYEIRFHSQAGSTPSAADPKLFVPAGSALYVTRFTDPDGLGTRLAINRYTAGQAGPAKTLEYGYEAGTNTWTFIEAGLRRTDKAITALSATEDEVLTTVWDIQATTPAKISETKEKYRRYQLGGLTQRVVYERILDPNGTALKSTWDYSVDSTGRLRLLQFNGFTGRWTKDIYYLVASSNGEVTRSYNTYSPLVNSGPASPTSQQRLLSQTETSEVDRDGDGRRETSGQSYELVGNNILKGVRSRRYTKLVTFNGQPCNVIEEANLIAPVFSPTDSALRWERRYTYAAGPFAGRVAYVRRPDITIETTAYTLDPATGNVTEVQSTGAPDGGQLSVIDGRRTTTITTVDGRLVSRTTVDIASGLVIESQTVLDRDTQGRPTVTALLDGSLEQQSYSPCCGLLESVTRHGLTTAYNYDALGRKISETADGITLIYTHDALDRIVKTVRRGSDGSEIILGTSDYDLAGRLTRQTDALGRITLFNETYNADGTTARATTFPDLSVMAEVVNADGSSGSRTGSRALPAYWEYVISSTGGIPCVVTTGFKGVPGSSPTEWVKTYVDGLGRQMRVEYPDGAFAFSEYDAANRLAAQYDPDGVTTLFAYNARGEQEVTALDLNGNGIIDYTADRITKTVSAVTTNGPYTVQRSTTTLWETDGHDTPTTVSISDQSADGLRSWQTARGLTTASVTALDGSGGRTVTTTAPDGVKTIQVYSGDLLASTTVKTAADAQLAAVTYGFDPHHRQTSVTDARTGTTSFTYFDDDQLHTTTTPDPDPARSGPGYDPQTTSYHYDSTGRPDLVTQPDDTVVNTTYWPTGAVKRTWGSRTYPVEYSYDPQDRVKTLTTWQNFTNATGAAVTTWNYNPQRGWLENKRYQDNTGPAYTYKPSGRLLTRTWARGVQTNYAYNAAGEPTGTTYSDGTPAVTIAYDRLGRPKTRNDAAGLCTWTYHASGQLQDEVYASGLLGGLSVNRSFDALARLSGLSVPSVNSVTYSYDFASRLGTVTSGANSATYGYLPNSPLVDSVTFAQGGSTRLTTTKVYDNLNRLASIVSQPSALNTQLSTAYTYNAANQRTRATREDNAFWQYEYDALGQVTSAGKKLAGGAAALGHSFGFAFDDIGNRKTSTANGQTSGYTPNFLNQYAQRTVPGVIEVMGEAQADATVTLTVNNGAPQSVSRQGGLFFKQVPVNNAVAAQQTQIKVTGVKNLVGPNHEDAVTEIPRSSFTAQSPKVFTHDTDGNLTVDGRWNYGWDGENRLIVMETSAAALTAGVTKQKLEFAYDSQSRRIQKKVFSWNLALATWNLESGTLFLYDGWNLIAELNSLSSNTPVRTYVWGLDLSGSMQGAGGVGGLLFSTYSLNLAPYSVAAAYDGNGNVIAYVDLASGAKSATYEYSAFGETLIADGVAADAMPFRFSTKYTDNETGLLYYGYRYYNPATGRWLSRDPIKEQGGVNLYGFVGNDSLNSVDPLGEDFIAVGTRPLAGVLGFVARGWGAPADHLSIEYYDGCAKEGEKFRPGKAPNGANRKAARELLQNTSYKRTVKGKEQTVGISFIHPTSTARDLVVIYAAQDADQKWKDVIAEADTYAYAEHGSSGSVLKNWPNSKYGFPATSNANNSNTFIRVLAKKIGKSADVAPGFHLGNDSSVSVTDNGPVPHP